MFALLDNHATGMPMLDAQSDFRRARRAHGVARLSRWLTRRQGPSHPPTLGDDPMTAGGPQRLKVVALDSIVGTVELSPHFDARFRPASELVRPRWERIALAHRRGDALPPVILRERHDGYYVLDGRHRVSVAHALGHPDIDAWVVGSASPGDGPARRIAACSCRPARVRPPLGRRLRG